MRISHFLYWLPMIVIAFLNGTFRQFVMLPRMSETLAHQVSTLLLIGFCTTYVWFVFPRLGLVSSGNALQLGLLWVVLTVVFEFSMGLMTHKTWTVMLHDYDISAGRIWPIFLICLGSLPYLLFVFRAR